MSDSFKKNAKILVFSTEKISDPAIDMAGLLKLHYPPTVYTITVPCSSGIKPSWIMHAYEKGFDGVSSQPTAPIVFSANRVPKKPETSWR
jgi:hypothetical protein